MKYPTPGIDSFVLSVNHMAGNGIPFLFAVSFLQDQHYIVPLTDIDPKTCLFKFGEHSNVPAGKICNKKPEFSKVPVTFSTYQAAFKKIKSNIEYGNSYLTNLTFATPIKTNLTSAEIFHLAHAPYKIWLKDKFVCFSPEPFVKISNGKITSFPMKGTIDASIPDALGILLADKKELAEHYTIVDLIRNDLSMISEHVKVKRFRYTEKIHTNQKDLYQVSSEIEGTLPAGYLCKLGEIIATLLPAGSISGAPKKRTVEIIQETEICDRSWYTGIAGIFDGKNLDSFVLIRFIADSGNGLIFHSGGGITCHSKVNKEYQEMIDKVYLPLGNVLL